MKAISQLFKLTSFTLLITTLSVVSICCAGQKNADQDKIRIQIEELLNQVQKALITVQDEADTDNLPQLDSVTLNLTTQFVKEGSGKISLYVLSLGADISDAATQTLSIKLEPPKPGAEKPSSAIDISESLANAILAAARGAAKARERKPHLDLSELEAKFKFVVDSSGSGSAGLKFTILPVTVEISGKVSKSATQEIIVKFK